VRKELDDLARVGCLLGPCFARAAGPVGDQFFTSFARFFSFVSLHMVQFALCFIQVVSKGMALAFYS
jgi:hypothetical protein